MTKKTSAQSPSSAVSDTGDLEDVAVNQDVTELLVDLLAVATEIPSFHSLP